MDAYEVEQRLKDQEEREFERYEEAMAYEATEITNLKSAVKRYRNALMSIATAEDVCRMQEIAVEALGE